MMDKRIGRWIIILMAVTVLLIPAVVSANENDAKDYYSHGVACINKRQLEQAIADFNKAIELNPQYAEAYYGRGAIELNPQLADAYANRGTAYMRNGQTEQGITDFNKAVELNPQLVGAYVNRGAAYIKIGQMERGMMDSHKAIELYPRHAEAYNNCGLVYFYKGQPERGLVELNKAIELSPRYAEAYYNRGAVLVELGRNQEALESYKLFLRFAEAGHPYIEKAKVVIRKLAGASWGQCIVLGFPLE